MAGVAVPTTQTRAMDFYRMAAWCAYAAAGLGLIYSVTFVAMVRGAGDAVVMVNAGALMLGGVASLVVMVALYQRLREAEPGMTLLALIFGVLAAAGSAIHGAYDLGVAVHPETAVGINQVDPRGFLTFAVAGLAVAMFANVIMRSGMFAHSVGTLGMATAALLEVVYLGRLILLEPTNPFLLATAAVTGLVAVPVWYVRLGMALHATPATA